MQQLRHLFAAQFATISSIKWAKFAKCSKDTAIRDFNDLKEKRILQKEKAGGRSTSTNSAQGKKPLALKWML